MQAQAHEAAHSSSSTAKASRRKTIAGLQAHLGALNTCRKGKQPGERQREDRAKIHGK